MNELVETHPFEAFVPIDIECLIVGSFPGREQTGSIRGEDDWFYGAPRNQFWKILEIVYGRELKTKAQKQALFTEMRIGITDVIRSCVRTSGTNLDENLEIRAYNGEVIGEILKREPRVLCTSRFVERVFQKLFPGYHKTEVLPSPSPRYFKMSILEKAEIYRLMLPT